MLRALVAAFTLALALTVGCGSHCDMFCAPQSSPPIMTTQGFTIVSATSSCGNAVVSPSIVDSDPPDHAVTCHFDIALDDGETFSFDVPYTFQRLCCCSGCTEGYFAEWVTVTRSKPAFLDATFPPSPLDASMDAPDGD